jgi:uncharacterized membrane protein YdjX (TVP38/TMEM64 family)
MAEETKPASWWRRNYIRILVLLATIILMVFLIILGLTYKDKIKEFENYGYLGIFLMGIAGSATPIWPLPGSWAAFIGAGLGWNIVLVALAAGTGEAIGEFSGYLLGYGGQPVITNWKRYQWFEGWMKRHGALAIFLVAAVPNPHIIKLVNASAGATRFPLWKWFLISWSGKIIKSFGFALAGMGLFHWLTELI